MSIFSLHVKLVMLCIVDMDWLYIFFLICMACFVIGFIMILIGDADIVLQIAEKFGKQAETLKGKTVWITGASSGIGEHLAYELAKVGCKLVLSARRKDQLERVRDTCIEKYGISPDDVFVIELDMVEFNSHAAAVENVMMKFQRVDILINNAGRSQRAEWVRTSLDVDIEVFNVNVFGVLSLSKLVLPYMIRQKGGHIVNMSSIAGKIGAPISGSYTAAKHAVQGSFDCLRTEAVEHNITITNLCPGPVFSNILDIAFTEELGKKVEEKMQSSDRRMETRRFAQLSVIAIANKLDEAWIALNPVLFFTYFNQYFPNSSKFIGKRFGIKMMKRIREGR